MKNVKLIRLRCECGAINYLPILDNRLIIYDEEERKCTRCGRIVSKEEILTAYTEYMKDLRGLSI